MKSGKMVFDRRLSDNCVSMVLLQMRSKCRYVEREGLCFPVGLSKLKLLASRHVPAPADIH
jgi:hypothetical protein